MISFALFTQLIAILFISNIKFTKSDFCSEYKELLYPVKGGKPKNVEELKFIPTKDVLYLYLKHRNSKEFVYEFDVSCKDRNTCPTIGAGQEFSTVFSSAKDLKMAFIQDGVTYIFSNSSDKVLKFENNVKIEEINSTQIWRSVSHATTYEWKNSIKREISRFIPPKSSGRADKLYRFSHDNIKQYSVELYGHFGSVYFRDAFSQASNKTLVYSFDEYCVPFLFISYLPLPNGDAIFNRNSNPYYVRKEGISFVVYRSQQILDLFRCDGKPVPESKLWDIRADGVYQFFPIKT